VTTKRRAANFSSPVFFSLKQKLCGPKNQNIRETTTQSPSLSFYRDAHGYDLERRQPQLSAERAYFSDIVGSPLLIFLTVIRNVFRVATLAFHVIKNVALVLFSPSLRR
jgi:hypothetical protein